MKFTNALLICLLAFYNSWSQTAADATQGNYTLKERYGIMKSKSQSFKDYKVIKETTLDGVWKIFQDSVRVKNGALREAHQNINQLTGEMHQAQLALKQNEESMKETLHASTHIGVLGIDVHKGVFITGVVVVLSVLLFILIGLSARIKLLTKSSQENKLMVSIITHELEDYKKKAMDKQIKLSRELQDERNKLQLLRKS